MHKRFLPLLLAALITLFTSSSSLAVSLDNTALTDIDNHWAEDSITVLNRAGILKGSDNRANPDKSITRGEFTALISRALSLESTSVNIFKDVPLGSVFYSDISSAYSAGLVTGMNDGNFYPDKLITREEIVIIISRCLSSEGNKKASFTDISKKYAYLSELNSAVSLGIISGYSDGTFRPKAYATRAECAAMITRLMDAEGDLSKSKADSFAEQYIKNDMDNMRANAEYSCGTALDELYYRLSSIDEFNKNGTYASKSIKNLKQTETDYGGMTASLKYAGNITYRIEYQNGKSETKTYPCEISVKIIQKNKNLFVFDYNINLKYTNPINLTWEVYSEAPDYAPSGVNVVSPSSFQISAENLNVESTKILGNINFFNALTSSYMNYAEKNGYDVWAMYKTDFTLNTSHSFLNSAEARKKAVELLIKYSSKYAIDGINFDFENIYQSDRAILTKHVREVALALHEIGMIISADVTRKEVTSSVWSMCYDRDALAETADYIMLMAYDEYYAGSSSPGSVASLDWTEDAVKLTLKEVPADKLVLGIPFYMRLWEITGGKVTSSMAISMQTAYKLINENNVNYEWIESDGQYKISWKSGNKTCAFWLENSNTVASRVEIAKKYSLAGIASWRRGLEIQNVWEVINNNLF